MPACEAATSFSTPFFAARRQRLHFSIQHRLEWLLGLPTRCCGASDLMRYQAKMNWVYIGCSTQRVPSLSKVMTRSGIGTKPGAFGVVVLATKSRIALLVVPSGRTNATFQFCGPGKCEDNSSWLQGADVVDVHRYGCASPCSDDSLGPASAAGQTEHRRAFFTCFTSCCNLRKSDWGLTSPLTLRHFPRNWRPH